MIMFKWAKELSAGEGFVLFILNLWAGMIAKTIFPAFPHETFAAALSGGFTAMTAQRYFVNKADAAVKVAEVNATGVTK